MNTEKDIMDTENNAKPTDWVSYVNHRLADANENPYTRIPEDYVVMTRGLNKRDYSHFNKGYKSTDDEDIDKELNNYEYINDDEYIKDLLRQGFIIKGRSASINEQGIANEYEINQIVEDMRRERDQIVQEIIERKQNVEDIRERMEGERWKRERGERGGSKRRPKRTMKRTKKWTKIVYKRICKIHKKTNCKCFKNGKKTKCSKYKWPNENNMWANLLNIRKF